jgi:CHAT domain-containing protein/tetratricopeptide (TPR) repeat protein
MTWISTDLKTLVDRALQDADAFPDLQVWLDSHRHEYRRPLRPTDTDGPEAPKVDITEYADWELRVKELNRIVGDIQKEARNDSTTTQRVERARVVNALVGLSDLAEPRAFAAFRYGYFLGQARRYSEAIEPLKDAVRCFQEAGSPSDKIVALSCLSDHLREGKYFDETIRTAQELIELARSLGHRGHEASGLRDLGLAQAALGREVEALEAVREALAVRRTLSADELKTQAVTTLPAFVDALGTTARRFGLFDEALRAFTECVELHRTDGNELLRARALSEIAYIYLQTSHFQKAQEYLAEAVDVEERNGPTAYSTRWKLQLGTLAKGMHTGTSPARSSPDPVVEVNPQDDDPADAYLSAETAGRALADGDYPRALAHAQPALAWAEAHVDRALQVVCLNSIGVAHDNLDRPDEAIAAFQKGIQLADRGGGGASAALQLRYNLATTYIGCRRYENAVDVLLMAFATSEDILSRTDSFASKQQIAASVVGLYELYALLMSNTEAHVNHENLLGITEGARARNMAAWAATEARLESATLDAPTISKLRESARRLRSAEVELDVGRLTSLTLPREQELFNETKRLQAELEHAAGVRTVNPWNPSEALDETLSSVLTPGVAILSFFCVPSGVCPVLVSHGDHGPVTAGKIIHWEKSDRIADISRWTGTAPMLRARSMTAQVSAAGGTTSPQDDDEEEIRAREACDRMLAVLRERLLTPLTSLIDKVRPTHLVVIPHRELALLPFWDLVDTTSSVEAMTVAPSLNLLRICRTRDRNSGGGTLLIDDVTHSLEFASRELERVRQLRTGTIVSAQTVEDVLRVAPDIHLLHAAAHGVFNAENPYHSGIVVSADESATGLLVQYVNRVAHASEQLFAFSATPTPGSYRLLTVGECLSRMSLSVCRLAVVSSCECGLADTHGGGELTSVPTSLLVSGAKSVIAAMWPVDDGATALLMDRFYHRWAGGSGPEQSPAAALAGARQDLRALDRAAAREFLGADAWLPSGERPYAHPLYADAFQCFGDW